MGLLDSNRINIQQKEGSATLNLALANAQCSINFNGVGYKRLTIQLSGIPSDADVIIAVRSWVTSGSGFEIGAKTLAGNSTPVTTNGTYYYDVSGLSGVYFAVTRRAESGTATINWSLSDSENINDIVRPLSDILNNIPAAKVLNGGAKTYSVASAADLETFTNDTKCGCFVVNVETLTNGASLYLRDNKNRSLTYISGNGFVGVYITSPGVYYFPINITIPNVILRCYTGVTDGSSIIRTAWIESIPAGIVEMKPVQLLGTYSATVSSTSSFVLINDNDEIIRSLLNKFKYFFYSYIISNGGSAAQRSCHITVQPYHYYGNSNISGKYEELSVADAYSFQSEWHEVRGDSVKVYAKIDDYQEGDSIKFNIYGVR